MNTYGGVEVQIDACRLLNIVNIIDDFGKAHSMQRLHYTTDDQRIGTIAGRNRGRLYTASGSALGLTLMGLADPLTEDSADNTLNAIKTSYLIKLRDCFFVFHALVKAIRDRRGHSEWQGAKSM
jgi:hypothetical protein